MLCFALGTMPWRKPALPTSSPEICATLVLTLARSWPGSLSSLQPIIFASAARCDGRFVPHPESSCIILRFHLSQYFPLSRPQSPFPELNSSTTQSPKVTPRLLTCSFGQG